jgi:hypothetical protein
MTDSFSEELPRSAYHAIVDMLEVQRKMIESSAELSVLLRQVEGSGGESTRRRQALLARMAELVALFENSADQVKRLVQRYNDPPGTP